MAPNPDSTVISCCVSLDVRDCTSTYCLQCIDGMTGMYGMISILYNFIPPCDKTNDPTMFEVDHPSAS